FFGNIIPFDNTVFVIALLSLNRKCIYSNKKQMFKKLSTDNGKSFISNLTSSKFQNLMYKMTNSKKEIIKLFVLCFLGGLIANAQTENRFFPEKELISTGVYYYPEHWPEGQWERDIKKISEMGFEF